MPEFDLDAALSQVHLPDVVRSIRKQSRSTFFYPGCAEDIEPLACFTDVCDTFVHCDLRLPGTEIVERLIRNKLNRHPQLAERFQFVNAVPIDSTEALLLWETRTQQFLNLIQPDRESRYADFITRPGAGAERCAIQVTLTPAEADRNAVTLYLLQVEGVAAYLHLFSPNATAPFAALVPQGRPGQHADLLNLDDVFGVVLKRISPSPAILVVPRATRHILDETGWTHPWRDFPEWGHVALSRDPM